VYSASEGAKGSILNIMNMKLLLASSWQCSFKSQVSFLLDYGSRAACFSSQVSSITPVGSLNKGSNLRDSSYQPGLAKASSLQSLNRNPFFFLGRASREDVREVWLPDLHGEAPHPEAATCPGAPHEALLCQDRWACAALCEEAGPCAHQPDARSW
jgi:hypothetical protein